MSLYLMHFDGDSAYVEAATMSSAVKKWEDAHDDEEPESCSLVSTYGVLR